MTTQYTSILKLALPVQGELSGTWGDVVNDNITSMVEEAVAGRAVINTWTTNSHTLTTADGTTSESRCAMLEFTDTGAALTGAATVVCPSASKLYVCKNDSGQQVTIQTAAGTGVAIPDGQTMFVFCDGTNVEQCETNFNSLSFNGYTLNFGGAVTTAGAFTTSGAYALTLTTTGATNVTLPTTGTLATLDGTETLTNKTLTTPTISSPSLTGSISATDLTISGNTTIGDDAADTLTVNGTITSNLIFTDNTYDIGATGATRPRDLFLSRNAVLGGTLTTTGNVTLGADTNNVGSFSINTDKLQVAAATGNTTIAGTLGVTGITTATGGLNVDTISEITSANGVTVDSVVLKDGGATFSSTVTLSGTDPNIVFTDTDTNFDNRISANSGAGFVYLDLDLNNETATSGFAIRNHASTELFSVNDEGIAALGVTPEAWYTGSTPDFSALQLGTAAAISGTDSTAFMALTTNAYRDSAGWKYINSDYAARYDQDDAAHTWYYAASGTADAAITWSTGMSIDNGGTVIIPTLSLTDVSTSGDVSVSGGTLKLNSNYPVGTDNVALGANALNATLTGDYNTAIGDSAGNALTTGNRNVMLGDGAGLALTEGVRNTIIGRSAGANLTTQSYIVSIGMDNQVNATGGNYNVSVGNNSLNTNDSGEYLTTVGHEVMRDNTTGNYNTSIGAYSLYVNTTGQNNTAVGTWNGNASTAPLVRNVTGGENVAIGNKTLNFSTGSNNTAVGYGAGTSVNTSYNTFIGFQAGTSSTGSNNVFVGSDAGRDNTSGSRNTILGHAAAYDGAMTGSDNVVIGYVAGQNLSSGNSSVYVGNYAADSITTGEYNVALGYGALTSAGTNASYNTAVGYQAGYLAYSSGAYNITAVGYQAGRSFSGTSPRFNVAVGYQAALNATGGFTALGTYAGKELTGIYNVAIGNSTFYQATSSQYTVAVGDSALANTSTGSYNVALGYSAGYTINTGDYNTLVGRNAGYSQTGADKNTFIGDNSGYYVTGQYNTILGRYNGNQDGIDIRTDNANVILSDGNGYPNYHFNGNGEYHLLQARRKMVSLVGAAGFTGGTARNRVCKLFSFDTTYSSATNSDVCSFTLYNATTYGTPSNMRVMINRGGGIQCQIQGSAGYIGEVRTYTSGTTCTVYIFFDNYIDYPYMEVDNYYGDSIAWDIDDVGYTPTYTPAGSLTERANSAYLDFYSAGNSHQMRAQSNGAVNFPVGVVLGNGSTYSANNLLKDYEYGTWTPTFPNAGSPTYTLQEGNYTKVGRFVQVHFRCTASNITTGATFQIGGFPFTSSPTTSGYHHNPGQHLTGQSYSGQFSGYVTSNQSLGALYVISGGNATTMTHNSSTADIIAIWHYFTQT